jgi:predicted Zn-dependent protease
MIRNERRKEAGRGRRRASTLVAIVALTACLSTAAASADHQTKMGGAHWGRYRWNDAVMSPERAFWLFDRTGNETMSRAIVQWVNSWNGQRNLNVKKAPLVMYLKDYANVGRCQNVGWAGFSFAMFCSGNPGTTGITSLAWVGGHIVNPYIIVRPDGLNYGQLFTAVTHEMGHMLGLSHRPEVGTTMHANANFDGQIHWYDQHDLDALNAMYNTHVD